MEREEKMVVGASRREGIKDGGMEREENDGVRSIERGGYRRVRDWRGRKTIEAGASRGEGIKG